MIKKLVAVSLPLLLVLTACSSKTDDEAALCDNIDSLDASIQALKDVNVIQDGTDALKSSVEDLKDRLKAVADSATDVLRPDVDAIGSALDSIQASIQKVTDGAPIVDEAVNISTGLVELKQAGEGLVETARSQDCR